MHLRYRLDVAPTQAQCVVDVRFLGPAFLVADCANAIGQFAGVITVSLRLCLTEPLLGTLRILLKPSMLVPRTHSQGMKARVGSNIQSVAPDDTFDVQTDTFHSR